MDVASERPSHKCSYKCPYTDKVYRSAPWHLRNCDQCAADKKSGTFEARQLAMQDGGAVSSPGSVGSAPPPAPSKVVVIDSVGEHVETPKFPDLVPVAAELARSRREYLSDDAIGALFEAPVDMLTAVKKEGESLQRPRLSPEKKALLVQVWKGPINDALMRIAGRRPELVIAFLVTVIMYGPVLFEARAYRIQESGQRQYVTDTKRGLEEAGMVKLVPADVDKDAFADKMRDRTAGK